MIPSPSKAATDLVQPLDTANQELLRQVHPSDWQNPAPRDVYDLVVLGAGTAGLVTAAGAAGLGARVALVERRLMGGDCLNVGCVPSKALLRSAKLVREVRQSTALGVTTAPPSVNFGRIMQRMRELRADMSAHDSAARFASLGVHVFFGNATFSGTRVVSVDGATLRFKRAVIATGSRPIVPPIPGLAEAPYLTNETLFSLMEMPARLAVIGGGPIGCEMAQAFARFGSRVTLFAKTAHLLPREDEDAAAIIERQFLADGVTLELGVKIVEVRRRNGEVVLHAQRQHGSTHVADAVLLAVGRAPDVESLELGAAGIEYNQSGIVVNDRLRTTNPRVYAAGDVCSKYKFTHAADAMARIAIQNSLFFGRKRVSSLVVPWCTYTDPEVAHVGLHASEARAQGVDVNSITVGLSEVDRAVLDNESEGFVRVHHHKGKLLGCTIIAAHAGEMIGEAVYAMVRGGTLSQLAETIHPYPTQAEALKKAGDAYRRTLLTPALRRWFGRYFRWMR